MVGTAWADVESCARLVVLCTTAALNQTSFMSSDLQFARRRALAVLARVQRAPRRRSLASRLALGQFCRERTLRRIYPRRASIQVTLAVAIMEDTATGSDRGLTGLLEACIAECRSQPVGAPAPFLPATLDP